MFDFIGRVRENPVYIKEKLLLKRRATVLFSIKITEDDKEENTSEKAETAGLPENKSTPLQQHLIKTLKKLPCETKKEGNTLKSTHKVHLPHWANYTGVLLLFLLLVLIAKYKYDYEFPPAFFLILSVLQTIYFCLKAVNISAPLIIREKEQRTLESIITTPLTPQKILEGKFWAVFNYLTSELTAGLPLYVITGLLMKEYSFLRLIMIYFLTVGQIAFFTIMALWVSGKAKNTKDAIVRANSIAGFIFLSPVVILIIVSRLSYHLIPDLFFIEKMIIAQSMLINPPVQTLIILLVPYQFFSLFPFDHILYRHLNSLPQLLYGFFSAFLEDDFIYLYISLLPCFIIPVLLWVNTFKHLRWTGKEEATGSPFVKPKKNHIKEKITGSPFIKPEQTYIPEMKPPPALPSFLPQKIVVLINFIRDMNYNPVYIKDRIIQKRSIGKKRFSIPSWTGYLAIVLLPFLLALFCWNSPGNDKDYFECTMYFFDLVPYQSDFSDIYPCDCCCCSSIDIEKKYYWDIFYMYIRKKLTEFFILSCYLQIIYFYIRINSSASCLFKREKELKTFESIISTPLLPTDILKGKFWGAFYPPAYDLTVIFPVFFLTGLIGGISFLKLIAIYLLTLWHLAFITFIKLEMSSADLIKKDVTCVEYISRLFKNKTIINLTGNFYSNPPELEKAKTIINYLVHWILYILFFIFSPAAVFIIFVVTMAIVLINPFFYVTLFLFIEKIFPLLSSNIYYLIASLFISIHIYSTFTKQAWKYALENMEHVPEE